MALLCLLNDSESSPLKFIILNTILQNIPSGIFGEGKLTVIPADVEASFCFALDISTSIELSLVLFFSLLYSLKRFFRL